MSKQQDEPAAAASHQKLLWGRRYPGPDIKSAEVRLARDFINMQALNASERGFHVLRIRLRFDHERDNVRREIEVLTAHINVFWKSAVQNAYIVN